MDAEALARAAEPDESRRQHYVFAHVALRAFAREDPEQLLAILLAERRDEFLAHVWRKVGETCPASLPSEGLRATTGTLGSANVVLVHLPPPEQMTEAHFVILVPVERPRFFFFKKRELLYFTIERSLDLGAGGRPCATLCEWTADGRHRNYGGSYSTEPRAMLAEVSRVIRPA